MDDIKNKIRQIKKARDPYNYYLNEIFEKVIQVKYKRHPNYIYYCVGDKIIFDIEFTERNYTTLSLSYDFEKIFYYFDKKHDNLYSEQTKRLMFLRNKINDYFDVNIDNHDLIWYEKQKDWWKEVESFFHVYIDNKNILTSEEWI